MKKLFYILRPHHWIKNLFVFLPLFFAHGFNNTMEVFHCAIIFIGISLVASAVYIINDLNDIQKDQLHPRKCKRPIASGAVPKKRALIVFTVSFLSGIAVILPLGLPLLGVVMCYFVLNLAYTFWLKQYPVFDVFVIALGFVIRVICGGMASNVILSSWIVIVTFFLALFLGFAKRRDDVIMYEQSGVKMRHNIDQYNTQFIDSVLVMLATITIVSYILYCVSAEVISRMGTDKLYITAVFVIAGIIRYLQKTMVCHDSGSPTKLLIKDIFLQLVIGAWITTFTLIIYFKELW